jgi:hypothetical protein
VGRGWNPQVRGRVVMGTRVRLCDEGGGGGEGSGGDTVWVGARGPLGVGGARGALRPVGRGMLASRYVHKAGRRDGRGNATVAVMTMTMMKWYRYREQEIRSAPPAAQLYRVQYVYPRSAYRPRARAIVYIPT